MTIARLIVAGLAAFGRACRPATAALAVMAPLAVVGGDSPLQTPEEYIYAPFNLGESTNSRPESIVKGYNQWPLQGVRIVRAEDLAFISEAFAERYGFLGGGLSNQVNDVRFLQFSAPWRSLSFKAIDHLKHGSFPFYCDPEPSLASGFYFPPAGEAVTNWLQVATGEIVTNITAVVVTNWWTKPNTVRPDWPAVETNSTATLASTNLTPVYVFTNNVSVRGLRDYILKAGNDYLVMSNVMASVSNQTWAIPTVAQMTNLYAAAARCRRAAFPASAQMMTNDYYTTEWSEYLIRYSWDTNENSWVVSRLIDTNYTVRMPGSYRTGSARYSARRRRQRSSHTEWHDGTPVTSYSPDEFDSDESETYNPLDFPADFSFAAPGFEGQAVEAKLFVMYDILASRTLSNITPFEIIEDRSTNLCPVKVYSCQQVAGAGHLLRVNEPVDIFEEALETALPLVGPVAYPAMGRALTVEISTRIIDAIAILTPVFKTAATAP